MPKNILRTAFTAIVATLCFVLILLTVIVIFNNFSIETYKSILEVLGIPTLFGMIVQSFIHQNNPEDSPDDNTTVLTKSFTKTEKKVPDDNKTDISGGPPVNIG